jgi:hypothetical protein
MSKPLSEYREEYFSDSTKASEINRNLALAGIVAVWTFVNINPKDGTIQIDFLLKVSIILIVSSLIIDLFQYLWRTITIAIFYSKHEKRIDKIADQAQKENAFSDVNNFPKWIKITTWVIFVIKILLMLLGYAFLMCFLFHKI